MFCACSFTKFSLASNEEIVGLEAVPLLSFFSHLSQSILHLHSIASSCIASSSSFVIVVRCLSKLLVPRNLSGAGLAGALSPLSSSFSSHSFKMASSRGRASGGNSSSTDTSDRQLRSQSQYQDSRNLDYPPAADVNSSSDSSSDSEESDSASQSEQKKRETRTMNSWPKLSKYTGLQKTQVKDLLVRSGLSTLR